MFVVFLYGTLPHEYLHDVFAKHTDTIEGTYKKGEFHIEKHHTHCGFLGITFGSFLFTEKITYLFETITHNTCWLIHVYQAPLVSAFHSYSLRGPPAFIFS